MVLFFLLLTYISTTSLRLLFYPTVDEDDPDTRFFKG